MNWDQLLDEATRYLQEYIRIQTINPPGNEIEGAKFFERIFEKESIPYEIFEPSPGRGSILATLKGNGKKKSILLLSHIDVVPVEEHVGGLLPLRLHHEGPGRRGPRSPARGPRGPSPGRRPIRNATWTIYRTRREKSRLTLSCRTPSDSAVPTPPSCSGSSGLNMRRVSELQRRSPSPTARTGTHGSRLQPDGCRPPHGRRHIPMQPVSLRTNAPGCSLSSLCRAWKTFSPPAEIPQVPKPTKTVFIIIFNYLLLSRLLLQVSCNPAIFF
jgi:hypothetical protein